MSHENARIILAADSLVGGYGKKKVLCGIDIKIAAGEIVAVIGHNGAGKSTLFKTLFGLLPPWEGAVRIADYGNRNVSPANLIAHGIAYVPQGNRVFSELTVQENLDLGTVAVRDSKSVSDVREQVLAIFPVLKPRLRERAGRLSGGEKQMLALGIGLMSSPKLLLLDEPSLGLDPGAFGKIAEFLQKLKSENGLACLVVEQKVREVIRIADRVYVLRNGVVSFSGASSMLLDDKRLREVYL
jgi:ABC-type branched-subunit amino acid transport system ATPase component